MLEEAVWHKCGGEADVLPRPAGGRASGRAGAPWQASHSSGRVERMTAGGRGRRRVLGAGTSRGGEGGGGDANNPTRPQEEGAPKPSHGIWPPCMSSACLRRASKTRGLPRDGQLAPLRASLHALHGLHALFCPCSARPARLARPALHGTGPRCSCANKCADPESIHTHSHSEAYDGRFGETIRELPRGSSRAPKGLLQGTVACRD